MRRYPARGLAAGIRTRQVQEATTAKVTDEQHVLQSWAGDISQALASRAVFPHLKRPINKA